MNTNDDSALDRPERGWVADQPQHIETVCRALPSNALRLVSDTAALRKMDTALYLTGLTLLPSRHTVPT